MQADREPENDNPLWFQAIVEQAPDAVIVADCGGAIVIWNRSAETLFGYSTAEVVGQSLDVIIPERLRPAHWEGFKRAVDSGQIKYAGKVFTTRSVHQDGSKLYVDLSFGLVRDPAGVVLGVVAIGRDCTGRYAADQALRARVLELEKKLQPGSGTLEQQDS